jgi:hypothetical protein
MTTQNSLSRDMLLESKEKSRKPIWLEWNEEGGEY